MRLAPCIVLPVLLAVGCGGAARPGRAQTVRTRASELPATRAPNAWRASSASGSSPPPANAERARGRWQAQVVAQRGAVPRPGDTDLRLPVLRHPRRGPRRSRRHGARRHRIPRSDAAGCAGHRAARRASPRRRGCLLRLGSAGQPKGCESGSMAAIPPCGCGSSTADGICGELGERVADAEGTRTLLRHARSSQSRAEHRNDRRRAASRLKPPAVLCDGGAGNRTLVRVSFQNRVYVRRLVFLPLPRGGAEPTSRWPSS